MNYVQEFLIGVRQGLDPQPHSDAVGNDGHAVTSASSAWNHQRCASCGHSFRRGDEVLITDGFDSGVVHADPWLDCSPPRGDTKDGKADGATAPGGARVTTSPAEDDAVTASEGPAFVAGLLDAFPVAGDIPVHLLESSDWRVPRFADDPVPTCLYCGHTFRAGECVVVCPCRPNEPRCGSAVHRDPAAGLNCWEAWRPDSSLKICPVTLSRVGGPGG